MVLLFLHTFYPSEAGGQNAFVSQNSVGRTWSDTCLTNHKLNSLRVESLHENFLDFWAFAWGVVNGTNVQLVICLDVAKVFLFVKKKKKKACL